MEREANYAAVGAFVLLVIAMAGLFVYWYTDARGHHNFTRYEVYFDGSVSGLTQGAPVRYLGVNVGRVTSMFIDPRNASRVQVIVDIDSATPVSDQSVAELSQQGVTGVLFIDLLRDAGNQPLEEAVPSERYPVIRSVHSDFDQFLSSLPSLTARLNDMFDRTAKLLSDDNVRSITHLIGNIDQAAAGLPRSARNLDSLVDALHDTATSAQRLIDDLRGTTSTASVDFLAAVRRLRTTSDNLVSTSSSLNAFAAENRAQLSGFVAEGLPQLEALLRDSRQAVQQIDTLSRTLNDDPSRLIYRPQASGVSIPP
jgi:phospholipid/cholesterol/gamma-HCH transport system substrate-binding protein